MSDWKVFFNNVFGAKIGRENIDPDIVDYLSGTSELEVVLANKKTGQDLNFLRNSLRNEIQTGEMFQHTAQMLDRRTMNM